MKNNLILILSFLLFSTSVASWAAVDPELARTLQTTTDESLLIATIERDGDSPDDVFLKNLACKRLAVYGTEAAIPALIAMTSNDKLNFDARFALEAIPGSAVDSALRRAATELSGANGAGVIDSIGVRRDSEAIPVLKEILTKSPDPLVQKAIYATLGAIGTPEAADILISEVAKGKNDNFVLWKGLADAVLVCASRLEEAGGDSSVYRETATRLFDLAANEADFPVFIRNAGRYRSMLIQQEAAIPTIIENLFSDDPAVFETTLKVLTDLDERLADPLIEQGKPRLGELPVERLALVLSAILSREDRSFSDKVFAFVLKAKDLPIEIRRVLWRYLGESKDNLVLLERAIEEAKSCVQGYMFEARDYPSLDNEAYARMQNEKISAVFDAWIAIRCSVANEMFAEEIAHLWKECKDKGLGTPEEATFRNFLMTQALRVVQMRRITESSDLLIEIVRQAGVDSGVRDAALVAFAEIVPIEELGTLIELLLQEEDAGKADRILRVACLRLPQEATARAVVEIFNASDAAGRIKLFGVMKQIGGKTVLDCVANACSDPETIEDATRVLGEWNNPDDMPAVADVCLKVAKESKENKYRVRCIRSFIRVPRQFGLPTDRRIEMSRTAFDLATRSEDKILVFDVFARIVDVRSVQAALSYANVEEFKEKACETAVAVAEKIDLAEPGWDWMTYDPEEEQKAKDARVQARKDLVASMVQVQSLTTNQPLKDRAQTVVERWK